MVGHKANLISNYVCVYSSEGDGGKERKRGSQQGSNSALKIYIKH